MNSLLQSLKKGDLKLAGELLARGCDPNHLVEDTGVTPMHLAAGLGPRTVCLLIQYGGDPNVRSVDRTTPVHVAAIWAQPECLQLLLDNGGDPFLQDQDGLSALDLSREYGNADIEQLLVNYRFLLNTTSHDQTITPKYTYTRLSMGSNSSQKSVSPDATDDTIDMSLYDSRYMEGYLEEVTHRRKSAVYLDHVQRQMDRYFSDGRQTHLVDITSPDHPYIERKDTTSPADVTKYENQRDQTEDSLHLRLSLSDNELSTSCDSFVTCDGDDLTAIVRATPLNRDELTVTDESDTDIDTEVNTVVKSSKFRTPFEKDIEIDHYATNTRTNYTFADTSENDSYKYNSQNYRQQDDSNISDVRNNSGRARTDKYCRRRSLFTVDESTNEDTITDKCDYCGNGVDSTSVLSGDAVLCSGCSRLNHELDSLVNVNNRSDNLPDVLPRGIGDNGEGEVEVVVDDCDHRDPLYYKKSRYRRHDVANTGIGKSNRGHSSWRIEGNKESLPDKLDDYKSSSVNDLVRGMRRSSISELDNLLPRRLSPANDSLISSDESFMAANVDKAAFHPSDISTITIDDDEITSYQNKAFVETDSRSYENRASFNRKLDTKDQYQRHISIPILADRNTIPNKYTSYGNRHIDTEGAKIRSVEYNTTKHKPLSSLSDNLANAQPVEHNCNESASRSALNNRTDRETNRNASPECQDLWAQVRADKLSRSHVLNTGFCGRESMNSYASDASTVDYVYMDKEHGILLRERHIPSVSGSVASQRSIDSQFSVQSSELLNTGELRKNNFNSSQDTVLYDWQENDASTCTVNIADRTVDEYESTTDDSTTEVSPEMLSLTNAGIRTRLRSFGDEPGPVTDTTRQAYLTRLSQLQADPNLKPLTRHPPEYPQELTSALAGSLDLTGVVELETKMFSAFQKPNRNRRWREGTLKSSFTYILMDPRVTMNLPNRACNMGDLDVLKSFISAIFYVGKGKRARPYSHLYEAIKHMKKNSNVKGSSKVEQILDIWSDDLGVVSLHCFQSVIPVEAYTREACMVDAISLAKLTNMKRGDYYGVATTYSMKQRRMVGVYLLKKALQIFLAEGERQISPLDIKGDG